MNRRTFIAGVLKSAVAAAVAPTVLRESNTPSIFPEGSRAGLNEPLTATEVRELNEAFLRREVPKMPNLFSEMYAALERVPKGGRMVNRPSMFITNERTYRALEQLSQLTRTSLPPARPWTRLHA